MGIKGAKHTNESSLSADLLLEKLISISGITAKRMFGGNGIFHEGKMFGLVDSMGTAFLKVDDSNRSGFEQAGAQAHGKMPYLSIPKDIMNDQDKLVEWTKSSIAISK